MSVQILLRALIGLSTSFQKTLRSNANKQKWRIQFHYHYETALKALDDEPTKKQVDELLRQLHAEIKNRGGLEAALEFIKHNPDNFVRHEGAYSRVTGLNSADLWKVLKENSPLFSKNLSDQTLESTVPQSSDALRQLLVAQFELVIRPEPETNLVELRHDDLIPGLRLPRRAKKQGKVTAARGVTQLVVGSAMSLGNVLLSMPPHNLPGEVAYGSMGFGATMIGAISARTLPKIISKNWLGEGRRKKNKKKD